jgi:hypothetical protein
LGDPLRVTVFIVGDLLKIAGAALAAARELLGSLGTVMP